jgi:hypothetical protein
MTYQVVRKINAHARLLALVLALAFACGRVANAPPRDLQRPTSTLRTLPRADDAKSADAGVPARSHLLGTIARKSIGPFAARASEGGLAAWIVAAESGGPAELVVVPFGVDGAPLREARVIANVPRETTSLLVRPIERGSGGWLVVWSAILDRGESLTMLELSSDGTLRGAPTDLQRTSDHVTWTDLVPTQRGALCLWAEETAAGDANILAVTIDSGRASRGIPVRVARGIDRWAAVRAGSGAALALVTRDKTSAAGLLSWLRLDPDGRVLAGPVAIGKEPTVGGDIDAVPFHDGWLLAWTDRTGEDPQVTLATVDPTGHVEGPRHAMNAVGGSSLVGMTAGSSSIALEWESPRGSARPWSLLHLATISDSVRLAAQPVTSFEVEARSPTELVAAGDGFALLTTPVPACQVSPPLTSPSPGDCAAVPMFVRYDDHLTPVQAEPLFVGPTHAPAALAWGLLCVGDRCGALASMADSPTSVFAIDLTRRTSPFDAPAVAMSPAGVSARVTGIVTLESGKPYIDLAAARSGDVTLVATMTSAAGTGEGAQARGETISVRAFDADGSGLEAASVLTSHAVPVGRVAIAAAPLPEGGAAVAWVAQHDAGQQVHVAGLDGRGRRTKEVELTTAKGDASSVAIAWAADGWLVAWVDWRDGNGEVYAARIDRKLNRMAPDQRITRAPGDAADLSLAVGGDTAWLAWSDPRESPREGVGDVYVAVLRARDAKRKGDEVRVLATAAHSRSPDVIVAGDGAIVVWIEDTPTGLEAPGAAMIAQLGPTGDVVGSPQALMLGGEGRPTAIVVGPSPRGAQAIVARSGHDWVTLDALDVASDGSAGPPWPVVDLDAPAPFDVALALAGGQLFYDDTGGAARHRRVRRLTISW